MKIDRRGREYATWNVIGGDENMAFDVTFDNSTWYATEVSGVTTSIDPVTGTTVTGLKVRALLAGPDAPYWNGAIVLAVGHNRTKLRVTDSPEIVIDDAGTVTVV